MKRERFPFYSKERKTEHIVRVYFPDDYKERRFPFFLVQDGLCAFQRDTPIEWECFSFDNALETVDKKTVIIAIEAKEWQNRTKEYSPYPWVGEAEHWLPKGEEKGEGSRYGRRYPNALEPLVAAQGVHHQSIRPRTPEHNGKVERSRRIDREKSCRNLRLYSLDDLRKQGKAWMDRCNSTPRMVLRLKSPNQAELDGLKRIMENTGEVRCLRLLKCLTSADN